MSVVGQKELLTWLTLGLIITKISFDSSRNEFIQYFHVL